MITTKTCGAKVELSNLNATHLTNQFCNVFKNLGEKMTEAGDESGQALLSLEKKCLEIDLLMDSNIIMQMLFSLSS